MQHHERTSTLGVHPAAYDKRPAGQGGYPYLNLARYYNVAYGRVLNKDPQLHPLVMIDIDMVQRREDVRFGR